MLRRSLFAVVLLLGLLAWVAAASAIRPGDAAPEITGTSWFNSPPLTMSALRGRVVAVEFWTYG